MSFKYIINLIFLYLILLLNLYIIACNNDFQKKIIVVRFKSYYPIINEKEELVKYIGSMIKRKLYWESENENGQKIPVIMNLRSSTMHTSISAGLFYLDEAYEYQNIFNASNVCKFNYKDSDNYRCITPYNKSFYLKCKLCYAKEKFKFYTDTKLTKESIIFYDIEFIHTVNNTEICFFDGLQMTNEFKNKELNLFHQIKNSIDSKSYSWMLKFNNQDEGLFIFGDILNNNNIHFIKDINFYDNYDYVYVKPFSSGAIFWKLNIDYLYLGNNLLFTNFELNLDINSQFIRMPDNMFGHIKQVYFSNYCNFNFQGGQPICFEKYVFTKFKGIYCKKKEFIKITDNYKILPELNFFSSDLHLNITFTPNELFREYNNTLFFLVGHDTQIEKNEWFIGSIFFQKYNIVFDPESKQLYLMKYINKISNNNNFGNKKNVYFAVVITLFISGIFFCLIGLRYGKKIYQPRKMKANELNDEYDYSSYNNKNKLGIDNNKDINKKNIEKGNSEYSLELTKTQ